MFIYPNVPKHTTDPALILDGVAFLTLRSIIPFVCAEVNSAKVIFGLHAANSEISKCLLMQIYYFYAENQRAGCFHATIRCKRLAV